MGFVRRDPAVLHLRRFLGKASESFRVSDGLCDYVVSQLMAVLVTTLKRSHLLSSVDQFPSKWRALAMILRLPRFPNPPQ